MRPSCVSTDKLNVTGSLGFIHGVGLILRVSRKIILGLFSGYFRGNKVSVNIVTFAPNIHLSGLKFVLYKTTKY